MPCPAKELKGLSHRGDQGRHQGGSHARIVEAEEPAPPRRGKGRNISENHRIKRITPTWEPGNLENH